MYSILYTVPNVTKNKGRPIFLKFDSGLQAKYEKSSFFGDFFLSGGRSIFSDIVTVTKFFNLNPINFKPF